MRCVRKRNVCWSCTLKVMNGIRNKVSTVWKQRSSVLSNLWIKSKLVVLYFSYTISNLLQWCIDPIKSLWISAKSTSVFVYWPNLCIECVLNLGVHKHPWYWYSYYISKYLAEGEISSAIVHPNCFSLDVYKLSKEGLHGFHHCTRSIYYVLDPTNVWFSCLVLIFLLYTIFHLKDKPKYIIRY